MSRVWVKSARSEPSASRHRERVWRGLPVSFSTHICRADPLNEMVSPGFWRDALKVSRNVMR